MTERPADLWEGIGGGELADRWGSPGVRLFASLGSTNDVARRIALEGAPAGTVVAADKQVAGRGRAGRSWASAAGLGLWFSAVARPTDLRDAGTLPLLVGLAAASALDGFLTPPGLMIKWPNDLLVQGRKLGGILCESSWEGSRPGAVVAGVGLNLLHEPADFPPEIRAGATSLRIEAQAPFRRLDVADAVVPAVLRALVGNSGLDDAALAALAQKDFLRGHPVAVTDPMTGRLLARGIAAGILPDGALLVRDESGEERRIRSGTARRQD